MYRICVVLLIAAGAVAQTKTARQKPIQQANGAIPGVVGVISDSKCKCLVHTEQAGLGAAGATRYAVDHGASYVLVANDKVYALNGDKKLLENFAGISVRVEGAVGGSSIQVKQITPVNIPGMLVTPAVRREN